MHDDVVGVLGPQPIGHGLGEFDADHRHPSGRQGQGDPAGADRELEHGASSGQLLQDVDRSGDLLIAELDGGVVVVPGGDVLTEVVLGHAAP